MAYVAIISRQRQRKLTPSRQRKRAGLITRRSHDRNVMLLSRDFIFLHFSPWFYATYDVPWGLVQRGFGFRWRTIYPRMRRPLLREKTETSYREETRIMTWYVP